MTHPSSKEPDEQLSESASRQTNDDSAEFAHQLGTALTIIRGQAQLIQRRAIRQSGNDAIALERSSIAIDCAVQRIIGALAERERRHQNDIPGVDEP